MFFQILLFVLPWSLRRQLLNAIYGYEIAPGARIGWSVVMVARCVMSPTARIGHLTMVKGLDLLRIDEQALLGNLNWVTGFPTALRQHFAHETERCPSLLIERHAAITNRHIIDCTDRVTIGAFATLGGFRSQILTHAIDLKECRQSCRPVTIGAYCFVGTGAILMKGSVLPDRSILGPGSVLTKVMSEPGMLYSGVPAVAVRPVAADTGYFVRQVGFVW
ncbi:acyltransferase [Prosthecomicrobium hirschii]|uniref:acyltransferase n=1 Tax=Prosthecodimorpha hirschii TaxID=665126 RepID=UPI00221EB0E0|nr:hypothetical protein [Prosthecomicrobium hirschii]MCW1843767.1 hypothetical protein [Prosthecomicrobium hirschii]